MPESPGTLHPYSYSGNIPTVLTDPSGRCYPPLAFLRQVEPLNCSNLDMALKIWNHPDANAWERTQAGVYIGSWSFGHAAALLGGGILVGEAAVAGTAMVTAVSQWGAAQVAVTTTGLTLTTGAAGFAGAGSRLAGGGLGAGQLGRVIKAGTLACTAAFAAWANSMAQTYENTDVQNQQRQPKPIVVELGYGARPENLIALANHYPNAMIYGVDVLPHARMVTMLLSGNPAASRIQLVNENYISYTGPLQNQADVVVSVAPHTQGRIELGIERFIKPGGTVDVVLDPLDTGILTTLTSRYGNKPGFLSRRLTSYSAPTTASSMGGQTVTSAIGVPLTSTHFDMGSGIEVYIPSW